MPLSQLRPGQISPSRPRAPRLGVERLEDRLVPSTSSLTTPSLSVGSTYSSNDVLVQFRNGQPHSDLTGTSVGTQLSLVQNLYEINLSSGVTVSQALAAYRADSQVSLAEPDYTMHLASIPAATQFSQQWSLLNTGQNGGTPGDDIGATKAWNVTTGQGGPIVAVLDTGIDYNHPDLYQNIWINQSAIPASRLKNLVDVDQDGFISMADLNNSINQGPGKITDLNHDGRIDAGDLLQPMILNSQGQDTGLGGWVNPDSRDSADGLVGDLIGWNYSGNNNKPLDQNGHGTNVAGIIGAMGTSDTQTSGVDPNALLMPVEFLDASGNGTISNYILGLNYAVSHGAKIVNNSWTGAQPSQALIDAISAAQAHGVIYVAAAGNSSSNNDLTPTYPASFAQSLSNVVSVAATDNNNHLASFSNYGAKSVTLAAPGVNIYSTLPNGQYGDMSGTSMAAPEVSGVMALVWSEHPSWSDTQVINQVLGAVTKVSSLEGKVATGGILNAAAAVGTSASATSTPPRVISATAGGPAANSLATIRVTFDRAINPSTFTPADVGLLGPGSRSISVSGVSVVPNSNDQIFDITFPTQTAAGSYTLYIGPNARDLAGDRVTEYETTFKIASAAPTPPHVVSATAGGPTAYSLATIRVTFNQPINPTTFTAADLGLLGPAGRVAIKSVTPVWGTSDQAFDVTFATQTAPGAYTLYVGANARTMAGARVTAYQTTFKVAAAPRPTVASYTSSTPVTLTPGSNGVSLLSVPESVTIGSVAVKLNISYPQDGDLSIHLQAPDGADITLVNQQGGTSANFVNTVFSQSASQSIGFAAGPFTGTYKPIVSLSDLVGKNSKGIWKLWVDDLGKHTGTLTNWTLTITPA
jgi:subtilisin family serine protease/subtilisin-like proprotein convertase family protein